MCVGESSGIILGDQALELEPMAAGRFGRSVFWAEGTANKPCNYFSLRHKESVRWRLQLGLTARPSSESVEGLPGLTP